MAADDEVRGATGEIRGDEIRGTAQGTAPVPLSVLDLVTVGAGRTATEALRTSVKIAKLAESRGFHRYWVAEHHSMPGVASSSPAVILANLAAHTDRIRLGSGGVMLPNHAPLVIAEQFGTLEALAPGRVDLGLGRAPGTDGATAAALRRTDRLNEGADDFPEQLAELTRFLDDDFPSGHPFARIHAVPGPIQSTSPGGVQSPHRPPIWLLGSSGFSARLAGMLGLPFAFAHHFSAQNTIPALDLYRESFRPSAVLDAPYALIGVSALATDDEKEARRRCWPPPSTWSGCAPAAPDSCPPRRGRGVRIQPHGAGVHHLLERQRHPRHCRRGPRRTRRPPEAHGRRRVDAHVPRPQRRPAPALVRTDRRRL